MPAHPSPHRNELARLRRLVALAFLVSLTACGSCKREEEPAQVVIVDEAGLRPRAMRRPFDRHHRDAGIPLLPTIGTIPHPSASTGAPAPPIE